MLLGRPLFRVDSADWPVRNGLALGWQRYSKASTRLRSTKLNATGAASGWAVMFCLGSIARVSLKAERPLAALTRATRIPDFFGCVNFLPSAESLTRKIKNLQFGVALTTLSSHRYFN